MQKCSSHWTNIDLEIWVENSVSGIQHIENRKPFTEVPPPVPELILCIQLYFYNSHIVYNRHDRARGEGNAVKMHKIIYYKKLILN